MGGAGARCHYVLTTLNSLDIPSLPPQMSACLKALVSLAGMALLQDPYPVGFDEALKVHVKRSARNQASVIEYRKMISL